MSVEEPGGYQLDHLVAAKEQILSIAAIARDAGKLRQFIAILKRAVHVLKTDPHGWGDPEFGPGANGEIVCHALLRPLVFRDVIYEQARGVVLLNVRQFAEFTDN